MFNFTENIKEVIDEIKRGKGIPIKKVSPDYELVLYLKAHLIKLIRNEGSVSKNLGSWVSLELNEGYFEEGIRKCLFFLDELNIHQDEEINHILKEVVEERYLHSRNYDKTRGIEMDFMEFIVSCTLNSWGENATDKTLTYDYCKQRFLINWDYRKQCWKVSGLGEIILDFTPLKAVIFLLSIDLNFSSSEYDREYFSKELLNGLLKLKKSKNKNDKTYYGGRFLNSLNITLLRKLGIIKGRNPREITLTPLGEIAIKETLKPDNPIQEMINTIVQSEEQGIAFEGVLSETEEVVKLLENSKITESIANSIKSGLKLFKEKKYLDAVKLFYPSIEGITNVMLVEQGEDANNYKKFSGLFKKLDKLEELGVLPLDLTNSINVTFSRNKILHGEYQPTDEEYVYPLCISCIVFLKRMIKEKNKEDDME